jgi:hypothetical protein
LLLLSLMILLRKCSKKIVYSLELVWWEASVSNFVVVTWKTKVANNCKKHGSGVAELAAHLSLIPRVTDSKPGTHFQKKLGSNLDLSNGL